MTPQRWQHALAEGFDEGALAGADMVQVDALEPQRRALRWAVHDGGGIGRDARRLAHALRPHDGHAASLCLAGG